jgi:threonine dehydratase
VLVVALVTIDDIRAAAGRIEGSVVRTPLLECEPSTGVGTRLLVKAESLQHTGSFKVRGALNTLLRWRAEGRLPEGVVCFSAGNHAAAVAWAGRRLGVRVLVAMPVQAVASKVANVGRYGGEIVHCDDLAGTCAELAADRGWPQLFPFDLPEVIAGQGTVGLELCEDGPAPDLVLVPVGGGGLVGGVAAAVRALAPSARVVGVEPATSTAVGQAVRAGAVVRLTDRGATLADGLTAPFAGTHTLPQVQEFVDDMVEVGEEAIESAWHELMQASKLVLEPSAAVGLAALRSGVVAPPEGGVTVLVASGGNVDLPRAW